MYAAKRSGEAGQTVVVAAFMLFVMAILLVVMATVSTLYFHVRYIEDAVRYAAEIAARPDGALLGAGSHEISYPEAQNAAMGMLCHTLDDLENFIVIAPDYEDRDEPLCSQIRLNTTVEVVARGEAFAHDRARIYYQPAVRVSTAVALRLLLMERRVIIRRTFIATSSAMDDVATPEPTRWTPTPVLLPTSVYPVTPTPTQICAADPDFCE